MQEPALTRAGGGTADSVTATQHYKRYWATASGEMTIRDDSQASSWPSWIEALLPRERDEPTDLRGMCAFLHNSSVDLCDLAYLCWGEGAECLCR